MAAPGPPTATQRRGATRRRSGRLACAVPVLLLLLQLVLVLVPSSFVFVFGQRIGGAWTGVELVVPAEVCIQATIMFQDLRDPSLIYLACDRLARVDTRTNNVTFIIPANESVTIDQFDQDELTGALYFTDHEGPWMVDDPHSGEETHAVRLVNDTICAKAVDVANRNGTVYLACNSRYGESQSCLAASAHAENYITTIDLNPHAYLFRV
jgi:hypothetical protein